MSTNLDLSNTVPDMFIMDDPQTASKSVLRKQLIEVNSVDRVTFDPDQQNQIRIKITSPSDFMIGNESYLKFDMVLKRTGGATLGAGFYGFPTGGAHNLFSRIQVRTLGRGTLIQEVDYYNEYQALEHFINMDADYVEQFGPLYGEMGARNYDCQNYNINKWITLSFATSGLTFVAKAGNKSAFSISITDNANVVSNLEPGAEMFIIDTAGGVTYQGVLQSLTYTSATACQFTVQFVGAVLEGNVTTAGFIQIRSKLQGSNTVLSTGGFERWDSLQSDFSTATSMSLNFNLQPFLTILQQNLPLFLFKDGIELILDLNSATRAFITDLTDLTYEISDVRYMCMMVTPHPSIQESYEQMWKSNKGLVYRIPSIRVKRQTQPHNAANHTIQWHVGCRSAMAAIVKQTDTSLITKRAYDITASHGFNLDKYQFHVGSIMFPQREVEMGKRGEEAYRLLMQAFGKMDNTSKLMLNFNQFFSNATGFSTYYGGTIITDSNRCYIGVDFSRVQGYGGNLTGIDLSHVPLEMRFTRSGDSSGTISSGAAQLQFTLFVWYDAYLNMNSERIAILS